MSGDERREEGGPVELSVVTEVVGDTTLKRDGGIVRFRTAKLLLPAGTRILAVGESPVTVASRSRRDP